MPIWSPYPSKPNPGALIDWSRPLSQGLMGFYAANEGAGGTLYDATGNLNLTATGFGSASPWGSGAAGGGLLCATASAGALATLPSRLQAAFPVTFGVGMQVVGTPTSFATIFGALQNNSASTPFFAWEFGWSATAGQVRFDWNANGTYNVPSTSYAVPTGPFVLAATYTPSTATAYIAGQPTSLGSVGGSPTYGATAQLALGLESGTTGRTCNALFTWAGWWNRALSNPEHAAIGANPWAIFGQLFGSPRSYFLMRSPAASTTLVRRTLSDRAGSRGVA